MLRIKTGLTVALATFLIGVVAAMLFLFVGKGAPKRVDGAPDTRRAHGPRLMIPNARWEPFFFASLDEHMKGVNLPSLRTVVLPEDDLEVRFWYDALPYRFDGVILRRSGGRWSAVRLFWPHETQDSPVGQQALARPKSGWEATWERLVSEGILTLPDASETDCPHGGLDGVGYVVEVNANKTYRTYRYSDPRSSRCDQARRVAVIEETIAHEFGLRDSPKE